MEIRSAIPIQPPIISVILSLLRSVYTHESMGGSVQIQFMVAVVLGLSLGPAPVLGRTWVSPPPEVKTEAELADWTLL
jgi:hypothetical protein